MACARQFQSSGNDHHEAYVPATVTGYLYAAEHGDLLWLQQPEDVCLQLNIENLKNFHDALSTYDEPDRDTLHVSVMG
ncbi:hypothetical protein KIN20_013924 [Parelaphostrongylus tenuis]|uniref:Uncharacterized protein n=1 Tax=Parelaphostrongylus tenuis TaxID=148309 RepID=A0AAD5N2L9_PARTN|nr:hypothetical protein KIN20_013924 [Parelaphostrongylus tenuis]